MYPPKEHSWNVHEDMGDGEQNRLHRLNENARLSKDLQLFPENIIHGHDQESTIVPPVYSIPYEWVGKDISKRYPDSTPPEQRRNYPDWFQTTPAFDLHYSGYTWGNVWKDMFTHKHNPNNIVERAKRWWDEDRTMVYNRTYDKIAAFLTFLLILGTAALAIWQLVNHSYVQYNKQDGTPDNMMTAAMFIWNFIKAALTTPAVVMLVLGVVKRTTYPKRQVKITDFLKGTARANKILPTPDHRNESDIMNRPQI